MSSQDIAKGFLEPTDLSALELIPPDAVKAWVAALNATTETELADRKLVAAIGTGGTISMKIEDGIRIPDLDFTGIFDRVDGRLKDRFLVKSLDAFRIDSADMTYQHVRELAIAMAYVWQHVTVPFLGFLVVHGTDTLQYTSSATSLIMGPGLPFSVVYTAAQKPIQEPMNDAIMNIRHAFYTLEALHANFMAEVVVVMGQYAMLGSSAVKVDDTAMNAFDAPLHKYVTTFQRMAYPPTLASYLRPARQVPFRPTIWHGNYGHTLTIRSTLGLNPRQVGQQLADPDVHAVLWFAYGAGTVDKDVGDAMLPIARERGVPIFIASPVNTDYKVDYASGLELVRQGIVPLYMTLPSALAKIEIALRLFPQDLPALADFMTRNYVGEVPTAESRFVPVK